MAYKVRFYEEADADLDRLTQGQRKSVFDKLDEIRSDPYLGGTAERLRDNDTVLKAKTSRHISVVYEEPDNGTIWVVAVGHSPDIYQFVKPRQE